jgi:hypothetical protein
MGQVCRANACVGGPQRLRHQLADNAHQRHRQPGLHGISYRLPYDLPSALVARALKPLVHWYTTQVIRQDVDIMGVQREGLLGGPGGGVFTGTEADLLHADIESYRRWLLEGGHGPGPTDEGRDIVFWI